jgi:hypothetical protein
MKKIARIFEDVNGYYICDDSLDFLDARGTPFKSRNHAISALKYYNDDYTHYLQPSGRVVKIARKR